MTRDTHQNTSMIAFLIFLSCAGSKAPEPPPVPDTPPVEESHDAHATEVHAHGHEGHSQADAAGVWTCPMHPDVTSEAAGSCPICGMDLVEMGEEPEEEDHMGRMMRVRAELKATLGETYDLPVAGLADADAEAGAKAYLRNCEPCHGSGGKGDGPLSGSLGTVPADHTDPHHARYYSDAGRIEIIRSGIEGTPMPGFGSQLTDPELLDLYAYIAGLRGDDPVGDGGHETGPDSGTEGDSGSGGHDHGSHEH
jgi:mono/diheme cytochrome c family protein